MLFMEVRDDELETVERSFALESVVVELNVEWIDANDITWEVVHFLWAELGVKHDVFNRKGICVYHFFTGVSGRGRCDQLIAVGQL